MVQFKINKNYVVLGVGILIIVVIGIVIGVGCKKTEKTEKYNMTSDNKAQAVLQAPDAPIDTQQLEGGFNMPLGANMSQNMGQELTMMDDTNMQSGHQYPPISRQQMDFHKGIGQLPQSMSQMEKQYGGENVGGGGYLKGIGNRMNNPNPATNNVGVGSGVGPYTPQSQQYEYL